MRKLILILISIFLFLISGCSDTNIAIVDQPLDVNVNEYFGEIQSYFLINILQNTTLSSDILINDNNVNVITSTNCLLGDAINIYDNESFYQGIITGKNINNINVTPIFDKDFNISNSFVQCGEWNLNSDGSINQKIYTINPPTNIDWNVHTTIINIIDTSPMDCSLFGSRTALSNGMIFRVVDGYRKNLLLVYNNNGFSLRGFDLSYLLKAPAGSYGFNAKLNLDSIFGLSLKLKGSTQDQFQVINNDDLTSQQEIAVTISANRLIEQ